MENLAEANDEEPRQAHVALAVQVSEESDEDGAEVMDQEPELTATQRSQKEISNVSARTQSVCATQTLPLDKSLASFSA